jgi:hypothetical protein
MRSCSNENGPIFGNHANLAGFHWCTPPALDSHLFRSKSLSTIPHSYWRQFYRDTIGKEGLICHSWRWIVWLART